MTRDPRSSGHGCYQVTFWLIVLLHVGFWILWLASPETVLEQFQPIADYLSNYLTINR
ncbi:MAG: hypothetical protein KFB96_03535 [Thiocapsa sp.]|uniref:hypothetical protein n=1 Tax=Thiocapsa sp. TaxID=2024551 RepID=UPI001BD0ECC1|nr:hypothetical protein [Thiocapsa sp.]QVL49590.1 MAG: hypothetical protein KFB96_03535 [Thiocapsa sp.]